MKGVVMAFAGRVLFIGIVIFAVASPGISQGKSEPPTSKPRASVPAEKSPSGPFRLKPGANGKICLTCHGEFEERLKQAFVHTPVKKRDCSGCHNPHASSQKQLLSTGTGNVCYRCHDRVVPDNAISAHQVVVDGKCTVCHDPHAAPNKFNLLKRGNDLCAGCHAEIVSVSAKAKFPHKPVINGCLTCHLPHASRNTPFLLKEQTPTLCLGCHQKGSPIFKKSHSDYPVALARCTTCHDPHGSDTAGSVYNVIHKPVANKMCTSCHEAPNSPQPFRTKKAGVEICRSCHSNTVNEAMNKNHIHAPVLDGKGCGNCHAPHASKRRGLLSGNLNQVCGKCHADTLKRSKDVEKQHPPVEEGNCTACHSPHASNYLFLAKASSFLDLCGECHDWQKHSTHPLGEKVRDKRNTNLSMDCISCHSSHGTKNKNMLIFSGGRDLCIQCHAEKR